MSASEMPSGSGEPVLAWIERRTATARQREVEFDDPRLEYRRLFSEVWGTFLLVLVAAGGVARPGRQDIRVFACKSRLTGCPSGSPPRAVHVSPVRTIQAGRARSDGEMLLLFP